MAPASWGTDRQRKQIEGGAGSLFVCSRNMPPLTPAGHHTRAIDPLPLPAGDALNATGYWTLRGDGVSLGPPPWARRAIIGHPLANLHDRAAAHVGSSTQAIDKARVMQRQTPEPRLGQVMPGAECVNLGKDVEIIGHDLTL